MTTSICQLQYLRFKETVRANYLLEDVFTDMAVDGTQRVIEQIHILVRVDGASKTDTLFLAATQIYSLQTNNQKRERA